jgi:histidyl-tRNA synthetase
VVDALGDGDAAVLVNELREAGLRADRAYGGRSMKAQMKVADRSRARYAVLLAPDEAKRRVVKVRDLAAGDEIDVHREQIAGWLRERSP